MNGVRHATNSRVLAPAPASAAFWRLNALFWSIYAASLMIPWLDRYSVLDMLPNKVVIAATGIALSGALPLFYRWLARRPAGLLAKLGASLLACFVGAIVFDMTVVAITQGPGAISLSVAGSFGSIVEGVPMPGRVGQYLTLLIAWSLAYHLLANRRAPAVAPASAPLAIRPAEDSTLVVSGTTIRARDGSRTILLERDEIDWIAADGDYIRLYSGAKNLLIRATMKQSAETLSALGFVRVHRSAIVNPRHVREIARDGNDHTVVLRSGARIRTGRNYASQLQLISRRIP